MLDKEEKWHIDKADINTQKRFGLKKSPAEQHKEASRLIQGNSNSLFLRTDFGKMSIDWVNGGTGSRSLTRPNCEIPFTKEEAIKDMHTFTYAVLCAGYNIQQAINILKELTT